MFRSWKLGKLFGIDVYVHWTFLLLVLFVLIGHLEEGFDNAISYAGLIVAIFGCVLLHEFGHALMARRFGIPTLDITLYPIGGIARLKSMGERPWEEFWIAVAGPAVNVAIAALSGAIMFLNGEPLPSRVLDLLAPNSIAGQLLFSNLALVAFNMLPAFPMDGGRVLRSLLSSQLGRVRGTEIAANLGVAFAALFVIVGFWGPQPMLILIGGFTFLAGRQELAMVRHLELQGQSLPTAILSENQELARLAPSLDSDFSGLTWDQSTGTWTLWQNGRPIRSQRHDS